MHTKGDELILIKELLKMRKKVELCEWKIFDGIVYNRFYLELCYVK